VTLPAVPPADASLLPPVAWRPLLLALLAAVVLALLLGACASDLPPRKRSFMASAEGMRRPAERPVGLNPLGALDTCRPGEGVSSSPPPPPRVLVSRPEHFTQEASLMISALGEALRQRDPGLPRVEFQLAPERIATAEQAARLGRACGAMIVLWEPGQTKTLELTLPQPTQVPLRDLVQERLCEFGNHNEQLNILYLTIAGLLSMRENEYDKAVLYMESARTIDNHCLHLPGSGPAGAAPSP
jgi:hypothetical protein